MTLSARQHRRPRAAGSETGWRAKATWGAWCAYVAFVVYGSLVPLDFTPLPLHQAWQTFRQAPFLQLGVESRADWVANGVLYVPMGLLGARALAALAGPWAGGVLAVVAGALLALSVEFAQVFFPPRTVSQNDLLAEGLGTVLGVLAAGLLAPWLARWRTAWQQDRTRWLHLGLWAYALLYGLYALFPFDLLISRQELADKLASANWGWVIARPDDLSVPRALLQWTVEAVLSLPLGLLLVTAGRPQQAWRRGAMVGLVLGVVLELAQLFIATGISQGASLVSRALGAGIGAWAWSVWQPDSLARVRQWLHRHLRVLLLVYVVPLLYGAGWGRHAVLGWPRVLQQWDELRFLPFYYHYYTSEAIALTSLGSTVVMYAPLAVLAWARRMGAGGAAWLAACLAVVVELGKLPLAQIHPDPTNVLLAGLAVWLLVRVLGQLDQQRPRGAPDLAPRRTTRHAPGPDAAPAPAPAPGPDRSAMAMVMATGTVKDSPASTGAPAAVKAWWQDRRLWPAGALVLVVLAVALSWPAWAWGLALVVVGAAALCAWRPVALAAVLPAALPVLDLAPWSGRLFVDEFDLLALACLAVAWARLRPSLSGLLGDAAARLGLGAFALSVLLAAVLPLAAAWPLDANSLAHLHSPFNGLRIAKGLVWVALWAAVMRAAWRQGQPVGRWLQAGMAAGLALAVAVVLWERAAMVSLFDFSTDYRVTGPFSAMNKGGAYIECYLAVVTAFVLAGLMASRQPWRWLVGVPLLLAATYAVMVTYSRNGYAALAVGVVVALGLGWRRPTTGRRSARWAVAGLVLALVAGMALPVLTGRYAQQRLSQTSADFDVRWRHWAAALDLRGDGLARHLLGMGLGQFPAQHHWHSLTEARAAGFRLADNGGNALLRLAPGATVYIEQIVPAQADAPLALTLNVRSQAGVPTVAVTWCRKTLLTSEDCEQAVVKGLDAPGLWQTQDVELPALPPPRNLAARAVPLKLSIATPAAGAAVEVDNLSLVQAAQPAHNLLRNGNFSAGFDHWFFATDVDPPWHIHSLPVGVLFDQGWLGVLALSALVLAVFTRGTRRAWHGDALAAAALAGFSAYLVSGSLNTLIDEPRFLMLFMALAWLALASPATAARSSTVPRKGLDSAA